MTMFLHQITAVEVVDARSFAAFAQQLLGTPIPRGAEIAVLQRKLNDFFRSTPQASWASLAHTVEWCRAKGKRPALAWGVIAHVRWCWADGLLPELDPKPVVEFNVEYAIGRILETETDQAWRDRLIGACGLSNRRNALAAWRDHSCL